MDGRRCWQQLGTCFGPSPPSPCASDGRMLCSGGTCLPRAGGFWADDVRAGSRLSPWSQGSRHCAVGLTCALSSPGSGWPAGAGALSQRSGGLSVLKQQFCESVQGVLLLKWKKSLSTSLFSLPLSLSHIHTKGWNYHFPPIVIPAFTQHPSLVHLFPSAWTPSHEPVTSCCQTTPGRDLCTFSVLFSVPEVPFPF